MHLLQVGGQCVIGLVECTPQLLVLSHQGVVALQVDAVLFLRLLDPLLQLRNGDSGAGCGGCVWLVHGTPVVLLPPVLLCHHEASPKAEAPDHIHDPGELVWHEGEVGTAGREPAVHLGGRSESWDVVEPPRQVAPGVKEGNLLDESRGERELLQGPASGCGEGITEPIGAGPMDATCVVCVGVVKMGPELWVQHP